MMADIRSAARAVFSRRNEFQAVEKWCFATTAPLPVA
jgi:hypothetical protein